MGRSPVKLAGRRDQDEVVRRRDQRVVMIGQHTPRMNPGCNLRKKRQQSRGKGVQPLWCRSNPVLVFVTSRAEMNARLENADMGWTMLGTLVFLAPGKQFDALFRRELPPQIARLLHAGEGGVCRPPG